MATNEHSQSAHDDMAMTSHHDATPVKEPTPDPIVEHALRILDEAKLGLLKGRGYNGNGVSYKDYCPNGVEDHLRCLIEPFTRTYVSGQPDQARDLVGYAALFMAWEMAGRPQSRFSPLMKQFYWDFWNMIYKHENPKPASREEALLG